MRYEVYTDGLCEPNNPGGYGCWGFVVYRPDGRERHSASGFVGHGSTNNIAEFAALQAALDWLSANLSGDDRFIIRSDSKLAINVVSGRWKAHAPHIIEMRNKAQETLHALCGRLFMPLGGCLQWVPREENWRADELSREGYFNATGMKSTQAGKELA